MRLFLWCCVALLLSSAVSAKDQISVQLLWKHQFQFAGYYMAIEKGFYADENLEVNLKEFDFSIDLVDEVIQGNSQFGVARTSLLIDKNAGADVVALFAAYQQSPLMLLTRKDSGILLSSDLKNKNVMITNDAKKVGELLAMLLQAGITVSDFKQQRHSYNVQDLIDGNTDAMASYVSNEPYLMEKQGVDYNVIHPKDYGFDMYSDILFSSREFIEQNPDLTDKFYRASMRGWLYAFENIEETAQVIFDKYNSQNKPLDALQFEGQELKKLAFDENGNFGTLSIDKFNQMAQVYLITGSIFLGYDFSDFIYHPPSNFHRLSDAEQSFINQGRKIKVCVNPDWYPYEFIKAGKHEGMVADYLELILSNVGLTYEVVPSTSWRETLQLAKSNRCDLIAGAMNTVSRSDYLSFSRPYLSIPAVITTLADVDAKPIDQMRVAVIESSAFHEILSDRYPQMKMIGVGRNLDGIRMVQTGAVDGFVGADANIAYVLQEHQVQGLELNDQLRDSWDISVAVTKDGPPLLLNIINKSIQTLDAEEREAIYKRWMSIEYKHSVDYTIIWIILAGVTVIAVIGLYRYFRVLSYNRMLQTIAERDALTGVYSRNKLRSEMDNFVDLANRHHWNLSMLFFDIDGFKQINDTYGHSAGDVVLVEMTKLITKMSRKTDRFGRWGGEEFLFIMLETDFEDARKIADKFRDKIEHADLGIQNTVTCSIGVAQYIRGESIEQWVARADSAMYEAKEAGKNCVRMA